MIVRDIHKSTWCVEGRHRRCRGVYCACGCHLEYKAGDFMPSIRWAFTKNAPLTAHMQKGSQPKGRVRTECGIWAKAVWSTDGSLPVCKRCLKATEK